MSTSKIDRLVKMINQISLNMSSNGSEEQVSVEVSEHLSQVLVTANEKSY